jgi:predicted transposase YdaD
MSSTDNPLKLLIDEFSGEFATWLLDTPVQAVRSLSAEFADQPLRSDLLFEVVALTGKTAILHIELQGRRSKRPMPYRQLDYLSRVVSRENLLSPAAPRLHSVVLYVGKGAGRHDTGIYQIQDSTESVCLQWQYQVIRLWELPAERVLQTGRPALIGLIGLTQITEPQTILPQAVNAIRQLPDPHERAQLLTSLVALMPDKELTKMAEQLLENDTLLLDTPFLQRMRETGREEGVQRGMQIGRQEGVQIGREEGVQQGMQIGRQEGVQQGMQIGREAGMRQAILDAALYRFDPSASRYLRLEQFLTRISGMERLQRMLAVVIESADFETLLQLAEQTTRDTPPPQENVL